jgi:hypothetical protein
MVKTFAIGVVASVAVLMIAGHVPAVRKIFGL